MLANDWKKMSGRKMMAAVLALSLAAGAPFALAGCDSESTDAGAQGSAPAQTAQKEEAKSDYAVTIDDCTVTKDYEGEPAVIIDYAFTNNSDEDTSFAVACNAKVFQNGAQLETAIVDEDLGNGYMAEIKPGASTQARIAYKLADQSEVSVEVEEMFSLDEVLLAEKSFSVA